MNKFAPRDFAMAAYTTAVFVLSLVILIALWSFQTADVQKFTPSMAYAITVALIGCAALLFLTASMSIKYRLRKQTMAFLNLTLPGPTERIILVRIEFLTEDEKILFEQSRDKGTFEKGLIYRDFVHTSGISFNPDAE